MYNDVMLTIVVSHFKNEVQTRFLCLFYESLTIGLSVSQIDNRTDGSCPSVSDGVDPQTFYTLCNHRGIFFFKFFFKVTTSRLSSSKTMVIF